MLDFGKLKSIIIDVSSYRRGKYAKIRTKTSYFGAIKTS